MFVHSPLKGEFGKEQTLYQEWIHCFSALFIFVNEMRVLSWSDALCCWLLLGFENDLSPSLSLDFASGSQKRWRETPPWVRSISDVAYFPSAFKFHCFVSRTKNLYVLYICLVTIHSIYCFIRISTKIFHISSAFARIPWYLFFRQEKEEVSFSNPLSPG